jgi:chemotaxis receptor (MCP) glutamine deamidase CheD
MPQAMGIDGSGEVDHSKPVAPSKNDYGSTNIETLSNQLQKISINHLAKEQKKKKPRYIDTSKLLNFKRESKRASSDS